MADVRRKAAIAWVLIATIGGLAARGYAQESKPAPDEGTPQVLTADTDESDATTPGTQPAAGEGQQQAPPTRNPFSGSFIWIMLGGFLLLYFWMSRGRRKKETKRKEMLANLKKGDKVTSIGGIVGTVIEIRENELTVKVDENNNVRIRFARWAIRGVGEEAKTEKPEDNR